MHVRRFSMLFVAVFAQEVPDHAQTTRGRPWSSHVVIPQARSYAPVRSPALQITGVTVGVVIREQIATTMMEIRVRNPTGTRQEAELLVPVPDGAVVRGFAFQGSGAEPSARLLPRDEGRQTYDRIVAQARDPALLEFAGFNLVRSSVFPVEPGGTQAVRLTYEHLLAVTGDRVDYVLPRSESVEYTVPWKIAVKITSSTPITAVYSPSHRLRTVATEADRGGRRARAGRWDRARPVPAVVSPRAMPTSRPRCSLTPTPRSAGATSCSWPDCRLRRPSPIRRASSAR